MLIVQSGEPVGEVVSLDLLKKHVRVADDSGVDNTDDDTILEQYLAAAVEYVQDVCGTILLVTEFTATGDNFELDFAGYPNPDIASITFVDPLGVPGSVTDFEIRDGQLYLPVEPEIQSATVVFNAGIGAGNIPAHMTQSVLMQAARFYEDGSAEVPAGVKAMTALSRSFAHG